MEISASSLLKNSDSPDSHGRQVIKSTTKVLLPNVANVKDVLPPLDLHHEFASFGMSPSYT